jgi:hypothetical protein
MNTRDDDVVSAIAVVVDEAEDGDSEATVAPEEGAELTEQVVEDAAEEAVELEEPEADEA